MEAHFICLFNYPTNMFFSLMCSREEIFQTSQRNFSRGVKQSTAGKTGSSTWATQSAKASKENINKRAEASEKPSSSNQDTWEEQRTKTSSF